MQVSRDTILSLLTVVLGVVLYHRQALELSSVGFIAIVCNMVFAVLERLLQRHLMAQDPVDISLRRWPRPPSGTAPVRLTARHPGTVRHPCLPGRSALPAVPLPVDSTASWAGSAGQCRSVPSGRDEARWEAWGSVGGMRLGLIGLG